MKFRKIFPIIIILVSIGIVGFIAFSNREIEDAWDVLSSLNPFWLGMALLAWFVYVLFDALTYYTFLKNQGFPIKLSSAVYIAFIGFYYSDITPSASGGQPMQVYEMKKREVSVGMGTSAVIARFVMNQLATSVLVAILWVCNGPFALEQLGGVVTFCGVGLFVNFIVIPVVIMAVVFPKWIIKLSMWAIKLGVKVKIIKDQKKAEEKTTEVIDGYRESFQSLAKQPKQLFIQFAIAAGCMLGLFMVIVFVYKAFGCTGTPWFKVLTLSALLFASASYTPLPGASGAQEGGFMLYFQNIFPEETIGLALLVWRFITFYLFLLIGPCITIFNQIRHSIKDRLNRRY